MYASTCPYCFEETYSYDGMHKSCHVLANPELYTDEDRRKAKRAARRRELRAGAKPNKEINKPKPTRCIETGVVFASRADAARWLGVDQNRISQVLGGRCETCLGYHFENA